MNLCYELYQPLDPTNLGKVEGLPHHATLLLLSQLLDDLRQIRRATASQKLWALVP